MKLVFVTLVALIAYVSVSPTDCAYRSSIPATHCFEKPGITCEQLRQCEINLGTVSRGQLIPKCRDDGKYATLQCSDEAGEKYCQCWDPEGIVFAVGIKSCDCFLARYQLRKESINRSISLGYNNSIPQCEASGDYKKHQCHESGYCWCAHPTNGTKIGKKVFGLEAASCA